MQRRYISIEKTAKLCQLGKFSTHTEEVWLCLHGYGLLAQYFIKHFELLNNGKRVVIAPEGMSRFYLQGTTGRVGASWMTKEERERDIEDNLNYLDRVVQTIPTQLHAKLVVLGFSQGAPTIYRWITSRKIKPKAAVAWASDIPRDVLDAESIAHLNGFSNFLVLGTEDEFVTPERKKQAIQLLEDSRLNYEFISFEGKHRILEAPLKELINRI